VTVRHDLLGVVTSNAQSIVVADQQITNLADANLPATGIEGGVVGPIPGIATFTDPAGHGLETAAGDFAATINWGDGTSSPGEVLALGGGNYRVDAPSHIYQSFGTFTVTVTVKHDALPAVTSAGQSITVLPELVVVGPGNGGGAEVRVLNAQTGALVVDYFPFGPFWTGSISVGLGDIDGDGIPDVVVGAGPGGAPRVIAYSIRTTHEIADFFAYSSDFRGGVNVAVGDFDGDGKADIITGAGMGGAPHVKVFSGASIAGGSPVATTSFFAYSSDFRNGVHVAAGDVDGDGKADIVTGTGTGGAPHVKVFHDGDLAVLYSFFAYDSDGRFGVNVGAGDITGDGKADIITGAAGGGAAHVKLFDGAGGAELKSFYAYGSTSRDGVYVGHVDLNGDGVDDIVAGTGAGVQAQVKIFAGNISQEELYNAFDLGFLGGVQVG
jgi:hypothetical protein